MRTGRILCTSIAVAMVQSIVSAQTVTIQSWSIFASSSSGPYDNKSGTMLSSASAMVQYLDGGLAPKVYTASSDTEWSDPFAKTMTDLGYPITLQSLHVSAQALKNPVYNFTVTLGAGATVTFNITQPVFGVIEGSYNTRIGIGDRFSFTGPQGFDWRQAIGSSSQSSSYVTFDPGTYSISDRFGDLYTGVANTGSMDFTISFMIPEPAAAGSLLVCLAFRLKRRPRLHRSSAE